MALGTLAVPKSLAWDGPTAARSHSPPKLDQGRVRSHSPPELDRGWVCSHSLTCRSIT